jgi:hypothetical protein
VPTSNDPEKAAIQRRNLKQFSPETSHTHGAHSERSVRPLRERFLTELAEAFPNASRAELTIQAQRLAQLELLGAYLDERGVIRHHRRGEVFPAAGLMERIAAAYEKQAAALAERERSASRPSPAAAFEAIAAELTAGEDGDPS